MCEEIKCEWHDRSCVMNCINKHDPERCEYEPEFNTEWEEDGAKSVVQPVVMQDASQSVQNAEAVGKYLARKYWDGLHDHPQASHCRDLEFDQYFELNKSDYVAQAEGLINVIRGEHFDA